MIRTFSTIAKGFFPLLILASMANFLQAQAPVITCPGAAVTYGDQSNNDAQLWNDTPYWDSIISTHDLAENTAPLEINITDTCTTGTLKVKYILYLDLDYNGTQETRVDSDTLPAANTIHYNNKNLAVTAGTQRQFDARPVPVANKYRFDLRVDTISPTQTKAQLAWRSSPTSTTLAQLPYGTHKIKWVVTNGCGQQSICEYTFIIRDDKPPIIGCVNDFGVSLMNINGGSVQLWASDFLQYTDDNYTPVNRMKFGIRKQGTGTGFPYNADGTPQTGIQFKCDELGTNLVELWVIDKANNVSFCETYVGISDNNNYCLPGSFVFAGNITTELGEPMTDLIIESPFPIIFHGDGNFYLTDSLPPFTNFTLTPTLDSDPLNGVNTWDLILMSRHILAVEPLNSPYKLISADINKSGTITTFDILEARKLILGTYIKFPSSGSWRFVDKNQVFTNPNNPFADVIRENNNAIPAYFIGTKIGDVDNSASPGFSAPLEDRTEKTAFTFQDKNLQENEIISLHFEAEPNIEGFQMTLNLSQFDILEIIPQNNLTMDNFAIFEQEITMVTEQANQGFDMRLRAKQAGQLSSMLSVNDKITRSVAFDANGLSKGIALRFIPIQKEAIQLNQNVPNPWSAATNIGFYLPESNTAVTFTVVDEIGRMVYTSTNTYPAGYQSVTLDEGIVPQAGIFWYSLTTAKDKLVQKMVKF